MVRLFSIARTAALAALALGAGALFTPGPAEARNGYGAPGGGVRFAGARVAAPRMAMAPRIAYGGRNYAPRIAAGYRTAGYRPGVRPPGWGPRPPGWRPRPPYYRGGWYGGYYPYWPAAAGVGLGVIGAAAIANTGYYYANDGYYADGYAQQCWLERRAVRTNYGRRVINVQVCPAY
ncbi:MAG: hypothetical protein ACK4MV_15680 [Beijerinckiaceae bacterium]